MKHTSGPWLVVDETIIKVNQHGVEFIVANLENCINPSNDKQLIAAAPEMLAALELIASDFDENSPADYVRIVNNVIKKAKGS